MGELIMSLFPELPQIDEAKTIENVRNYFENEFPEYVDRCSFSTSFIKSPIFEITGVKGSGKGNSEENKIYNHLGDSRTYDFMVEETAATINKLSEPYKSILADVYFKGSTNIQTQALIQYGPTRYSQLKRQAFLKFGIKWGSYFTEYIDDDIQKVNTM